MSEVDILLVEDNAADIELTRETMRSEKICNNLHVVRDGEEALDFLRKVGRFADAPRPDLVLLDLNIPKKDGREVLREMKSDDTLMDIPVVVLTSSDAQEDIAKSYNLHCNAYVRKPIDFEGYKKVVRAIDQFWFKLVKFPPS